MKTKNWAKSKVRLISPGSPKQKTESTTCRQQELEKCLRRNRKKTTPLCKIAPHRKISVSFRKNNFAAKIIIFLLYLLILTCIASPSANHLKDYGDW